MPMTPDGAARWIKTQEQRDEKITSAIKALERARAANFEGDASWEMFDAESLIQEARDFNVEMGAIRKGI